MVYKSGICFVIFLGGEEDEDDEQEEARTGRGRKSGVMGWARRGLLGFFPVRVEFLWFNSDIVDLEFLSFEKK
jgi:hypothetical protein